MTGIIRIQQSLLGGGGGGGRRRSGKFNGDVTKILQSLPPPSREMMIINNLFGFSDLLVQG